VPAAERAHRKPVHRRVLDRRRDLGLGPRQRGTLGGLIGISQMLGTVLGACTSWPTRRTAVLPAAADRAKDLGVINVAYSLPLVVAPIIAGAVLGLMHSYPSLFALAGLASIATGVTITRVRSVR